MEQAMAATRQAALVVFQYYRSLREAGFDDVKALALAGLFQSDFWRHAMGQKREKESDEG